MRLTLPASCRNLGPVCIMQQIDVLELESRPPTIVEMRPPSAFDPASSEISPGAPSPKPNKEAVDSPRTVCFSHRKLGKILSKMVIIVPCKNESPKTIRNVLRGIPADCAVILVSNCAEGYQALSEMLEGVCEFGRQAILIHQKYQGAAAAFETVGVPELLEPSTPERIRDGKGEGMYLGIAIARTFFPDRHYVGFVDADNQVPGSVNEYCRVYAAGFNLSHQYREAGAEQVMVRIAWQCKPKVRDGQISYEEPEGRSSRVVNSWLNRVFAKPFGDDSKFITTGNAGEHAMTMDMALSSRWANGYAIETYQFMDPFLRPSSDSGATTDGIESQSRASISFISDIYGSTGSDSDTDSISDSSGISVESASSYGDVECIDEAAFNPSNVGSDFDMSNLQLAGCATHGTPDNFTYTGDSVGVIDALAGGPLVARVNSSHTVTRKPVRILQIGTLNPHLHRQGDDHHILRMWAAGLGAIWHNLSPSTLIPGVEPSIIEKLRVEMAEYAVKNGELSRQQELPKPRVYPALDHADFEEFKNLLMNDNYLDGFGAPQFFGLPCQMT